MATESLGPITALPEQRGRSLARSYFPALSAIKELVKQGNLVPIYREILADMETPVSAYKKVARQSYSFLLESVEGGERLARYSFVGISPYLVLTVAAEKATLRWLSGPHAGHVEESACTDPLDAIKMEMDHYIPVHLPGLPRFHGGAVGYLAYETAGSFERLNLPERSTLGLPEAIFCFTQNILVFDHLKHRIKVLTHVELDGDETANEQRYHAATARIETIIALLEGSLPRDEKDTSGGGSFDSDIPSHRLRSNRTKAGFEEMVEKAKEYICAGDVIQVVLSQRLERPTTATPFAIYRALRGVNPSPYMFYLDMESFVIAGASPELLVQVEDGLVAVHPIAGTRPRGKDPDQDKKLEQELRADEKERAEHIMLVDLGRNDVGRVCVPGTVKLVQFMDVERYSHVMHLVSHVTGKLRPELTPYDALRAGFPAGTVSGAPKIRAMNIISELEGEQRGVYAGGVGYFSYSGNLDTCIALRTLVIKDGIAYAQVGAGLVADSDPATEYQETLNKAGALLVAIEEAERL